MSRPHSTKGPSPSSPAALEPQAQKLPSRRREDVICTGVGLDPVRRTAESGGNASMIAEVRGLDAKFAVAVATPQPKAAIQFPGDRNGLACRDPYPVRVVVDASRDLGAERGAKAELTLPRVPPHPEAAIALQGDIVETAGC